MSQTKIGVGMIDASSIGDAKVLQGNGAWVTPSSGFEALIGSTVISNDATISFTVDTTYDVYKFVIVDCVPATDDVDLWMRFGDSGGIDSGASDYSWSCTEHEAASATSGHSAIVLGGNDNADAQMKIMHTNTSGVGNATGEGVNAILYVFANETSGGTMFTSYTIMGSLIDKSSVSRAFYGAGARAAALTLTTVQFLFESGNLSTGRITCFGLKHAS